MTATVHAFPVACPEPEPESPEENDKCALVTSVARLFYTESYLVVELNRGYWPPAEQALARRLAKRKDELLEQLYSTAEQIQQIETRQLQLAKSLR